MQRQLVSRFSHQKSYLGLLSFVLAVFVGLVVFASPASASSFQLTGRVTNESSASISGASVDILTHDTTNIISSSITDGSGNYSLSVDEGTYDVRVTPPSGSGFQVATVTNEVITNNSILNFVLVPLQNFSTISGHIRDKNDQPVSGVSVGSTITGQITTTDVNGFYTFNVPDGAVTIRLQNDATSSSMHNNWQILFNSVEVSQNTTFDVKIPTNSVTFHVQDSNNSPIPQVTVKIGSGATTSIDTSLGAINGYVSQISNEYTIQGTTNSNGEFTGTVITGGSSYYYAIPQDNTYIFQRNDISISSDIVIPVTLQNTPVPSIISGHVLDNNNNPISNLTIGSQEVDQNATTTDSNGFYSMPVTPGNINVILKNEVSTSSLPNSWRLALDPINATHDVSLDIRIPTSHVTFHVKDSNNNPVAQAIVRVRADARIPFLTSIGTVNGSIRQISNEYMIQGATDNAGDFNGIVVTNAAQSFDVIPPSDVYQYQLKDIHISSDTTIPVTLVDTPVPSIVSGHIRDRNNNPISGITVGSPNINDTTTTDSSGFYSLSVPPGSIPIRLQNRASTSSMPNSWQANFNPIDARHNVTFDVQIPTSNVTFHVQNSNGNPIAQTLVRVTPDGSTQFNTNLGQISAFVSPFSDQLFTINGHTDENGNFSGIVVNATSHVQIYPPNDDYHPILSDLNFSSDLNQTYVLQSTNLPPTVDAHGPYEVDQGDSVQVNASGNDPESTPLSYAWDLDNNGSFETEGQNPIFSASSSSPGTYTIAVRVTDGGGLSATDQATVTILRRITSLEPAQVWIGLKNSDDAGVKFDLLAEVYNDNTLVTSGKLDSVAAGSSGFSNAHLSSISFDDFSATDFPVGSTLKVELYVRNACSGSSHNSGIARLWFGDSAANSHFGSTIGGSSSSYYLMDNFLLSTTVGSGPKKSIDIQSGAKCSAYKPFGTWTIIP